MAAPVLSGELDHAPLRGEIPAQDPQGAGRLQRLLDGCDDILAFRLDGCVRDLAEGLAPDGDRPGVDELALLQLAGDERHAAGAEHVGRVVAAPRLHVGEHGRPRRDLVEVVDRERDAELPRDREEVQDAVGRAARRDDRRCGVLDRLASHDVRRPDVAAHEVHHQPPAFGGRLGLLRRQCRDAVEPSRAEAGEFEDRRHRVGGELTAAGTGARAGGRLQLVEVGVRDLPGRVRPDPLVYVGDRHLAAAIEPGCDRAGVVDDRGDVEPADGHRSAGVRLVAGDELDEAVEQVPARDELDRVGDHLA